MAIEIGVLIAFQSLAKLYGVGFEIVMIRVGGHILSIFSNPTHSAC